jgi:hypothetical protein
MPDKSQWQIRPGFILWLVIIFLVIPFLASIEFPAVSGKPRGNRLALEDCRFYLTAASSIRENSSVFEFSKLSNEERHRALILSIYLNLLVKTNFIWATDNSNREIVAVCPTLFSNVPEPILLNFYHKNFAHAVGYSDGTTGLISPKEFANLNLSNFVSAADLATNSEFNIFTNK